jgi:hypothetical protein
MKVLFLGVFDERSTNVSQAEALRRAGCEVIEYPYRQWAHELGVGRRDEDVITTVQCGKPDLVIFSKCNGVHHSVVDGCRKAGAKTVLWYMDPMGNFNNELKEKITKVDATFFALTKPFEEARKMWPDKVFFLREGFDVLVDKPVDVEECRDVTFTGSLYGERAKYHEAVGFEVVSDAYGEDHARVVCESRINLNFTQGGTSDRTYKVLAAGGFLLTQPWPGMEKDFKAGRHLDVFTSVDDLQEKIYFWLRHEGERIKMARAGHRAVQKFTRDEWARRVKGV